MLRTFRVLAQVKVDGKRVIAEQSEQIQAHDKGEAERKLLGKIRDSVEIVSTAYTRDEWEKLNEET